MTKEPAAPHRSEITVKIELDTNRIPEKIAWSAADGGVVDQETKALFLTVWDNHKHESLRIDLWTKDMPIDEMKRFFHQTFVTMGQTYMRATQDEKMAGAIQDFSDFFADKLELQ